MHKVGRALSEGNQAWIAKWLRREFRCTIPKEPLRSWVERARKMMGDRVKGKKVVRSGIGWYIIRTESEMEWLMHGWQDDDWRIWFSNRLREVHEWPQGVAGGSSRFPRYVVMLHYFEIHREQTPEMLARLRNEPVEESRGPSTSKIERTQVVLEPIDRVAARVVGQDK